MTGTVVAIGATGPLGRRVSARLAAEGDEVRTTVFDAADLGAVLDRASTAVALGHAVRASAALDGTGLVAPDEPATRHLLDAVAEAGVGVVVWLSSAMVYGAWPENPIPLTETAVRRPNPGLRFAEDKSDRDRQVLDWAAAHPSVRVVVLRPTVTVGADHSGWLARSPWSVTGVQVGDADAPSQFVHVDDVAAAVALAVARPLAGVYNVAPDGWIPAEQLRALSGPTPRLHLPAAAAELVARLRFRAGFTGTPPAALPYTVHPWVVANDRLRAAGWEPGHSNEEAFVEADDGGIFAGLDPRRRQLLSLGAVGFVGAALVAAVAGLIVRRSRRR